MGRHLLKRGNIARRTVLRKGRNEHVELFLGSDAFRRGRALEQRRLEWADQINLLDQEVFDLSDSTQLAAAITAIRIGPLLSPARLVVWRNAEALLKVKLRLQGELEEALAGRADDLILLMECRTSPGKKGARPTVVPPVVSPGAADLRDGRGGGAGRPRPGTSQGRWRWCGRWPRDRFDLSADHAAAAEMVASTARAATEVRKIQARRPLVLDHHRHAAAGDRCRLAT